MVYLPVTWSSSLPQNWFLLPATGLCHFATLALALLVLLEALAQVGAQKMVRDQCGVRPRACNSMRFLLLPAPPLSHCLQFSQVGRGSWLRPLGRVIWLFSSLSPSGVGGHGRGDSKRL